MKAHYTLGLVLMAACPFAKSQVAPAATSGSAGLSYALRYSETANYADTLGTWHTIDTSGSLDYTNGRTNRPFGLVYSGGYTSTLSGPSYSQGAFQVLSISQGINWRKWLLEFSDDIGYRPQAPTTGFSGIPGTGEPIGAGSNPSSSQLILTVNTHALNNHVSGELQHILSHDLVLNINANHDLLRYPDGNGIDTDQLSIGAGPTLRLDARNSLTAQYAFSQFSYSDYDTRFETDAVTFGYQRMWNRAFRSSVALGPAWIRTSAVLPGSTQVSAQASLDFQSRTWSAGLAYNRGTSGGSGYLMGAESDTANASLSRSFGRTLNVEMTGGYRNTSELANQGNITGEYGGVQASWRMGKYVSAFANYTATSQSSSAQVPSNVLNQLMQVVSLGISFSKDLKAVK